MAETNNSKKQLESKVRTMPNNEMVEKSLLSVIMRDQEVAPDIFAKVNDTDFYAPRHQELYRNLRNRYKNGQPYDPVGVISGMTEESLSKCGGELYIFDVAGFEYSSATFEDDIVVLKDLANSRKILKITDIIQQRVYNNEKADDIIAYTQDEFFGLKTANEKRELKKVNEVSNTVMNRIYDALTGKLENRCISTGYSVLDGYANGGFYPSQMLVLAARPGKGKTAYAMNIVQNVAKNDPDRVIAVFSLEMAKEELIMRMYANEAKVDNKIIKKGEGINQAQLDRIEKAQGIFDASNIYIDDSADITMNEISLKCRRLKAKAERLDLIVIDHMQLIKDSVNKSRSRYEQITDISRAIKVLAKDLEVPVLVLSQMSRAYEQDGSDENNPIANAKKVEKEKRLPRMSDLRESGGIEQDADMVMFITEVDFVHDDGVEPTGIWIAKNRSGENEKMCYYEWNKGEMRFTEKINSKLKDSQKKDEEKKKEEEEQQATQETSYQSGEDDPNRPNPGEEETKDPYDRGDIPMNETYSTFVDSLKTDAGDENKDM